MLSGTRWTRFCPTGANGNNGCDSGVPVWIFERVLINYCTDGRTLGEDCDLETPQARLDTEFAVMVGELRGLLAELPESAPHHIAAQSDLFYSERR